MPRLCYTPKNFADKTLLIIELANDIIEEYVAQGFVLTLRQLYYQFIGRDLFPPSWIDEAYNFKRGLPPDTKGRPNGWSNGLRKARRRSSFVLGIMILPGRI